MKKNSTQKHTNRNAEIVNNLAIVMARKGLTDEALGKLIKRRANYVNVIKNGVHWPGLPLALLIARALDVPVGNIWSLRRGKSRAA